VKVVVVKEMKEMKEVKAMKEVKVVNVVIVKVAVDLYPSFTYVRETGVGLHEEHVR
jgi:hypothetical protein